MTKMDIKLNVAQDNRPPPNRESVLFAYGFRPFFLLAGLWAVISMGMWLMIYSGAWEPELLLPPSWWHAHELLFGFLAAAAAGFLLTAVSNWTGQIRLHGRPLAALVAIWLAGRVCMLFAPLVPAWIASVADLMFLPLLVAATALPVIRSGRYHQGAFTALMGLLWVGNLLVHLEILGVVETARTGFLIGIDAMVWVIVALGGRMLPAFTQNAFAAQGINARIVVRPQVEKLAVGGMALVILGDALAPDHVVTGVALIAVALVHGVRLSGWQPLKTRWTPIAWVMHLAYAWLVLGLALRGVAILTDWMSASTALHALTVGAFGVAVTGIMSRVSLAHTGRPLVTRPTIVAIYVLVAVAAVLRVGLVELAPDLAVMASGAAWAAGFAMFLGVYGPILMRPRADGRPG